MTERIIASADSELQWGSDVVLLWDPPTANGRAPGWLLELYLCDLRKCGCQTLDLRVQRIDDRLLEVEDLGEDVALSWRGADPGFSKFEASLDLLTGRVAAPWGHVPERAAALDSADGRALAASIRGPLLDELWLRLERSKGGRPDRLRNRPPASWQFGNLLRWRQISSNPRLDLYEIDIGRFAAETMLCPVPTCDCREVFVDFFAFDAGDRRDEAGRGPTGTVKIPLDDDRAVHLEPDPDESKQRFEAAWQAYVNRWPRYRQRVEEQYLAARRALAASIATPADDPVVPAQRSGKRIGRNQPCPCGSGRKYKRCCLLEQQRT